MAELTVAPEELTRLAASQERAAALIGNAAAAAEGIGTSVWLTHGVICAGANTAIKGVEDIRHAAVTAVQKAAEALALDLRAAAATYADTDDQAAATLDQQARFVVPDR